LEVARDEYKKTAPTIVCLGAAVAAVWEEHMRFGFFDQLPCADWQSRQRSYQDILAQVEHGNALGFDTVWLGGLHFVARRTAFRS
jgi:hypothetical protein